jgi:hypothetical protein
VSTPHDSLFRDTFGRPEHAAPLLRALIAPPLVAAIDWDSLCPEPQAQVELLQRRFGSIPKAISVRIGKGRRNDIDRWAERVLNAATLADVFAD